MKSLIYLAALALCSCAGDEKPFKQVEAEWYCQQAAKAVEICHAPDGGQFHFVPVLRDEREQLSRQAYQITFDYAEGTDRGHLIDISTGEVYCFWHVDYPVLPDYIFDTSWQPGECASDHTTSCGCPP
jgi:hypothetical protein